MIIEGTITKVWRHHELGDHCKFSRCIVVERKGSELVVQVRKAEERKWGEDLKLGMWVEMEIHGEYAVQKSKVSDRTYVHNNLILDVLIDWIG